MSKTIISCATHDYIEIACTFGYQIILELQSGTSIEGKAITTRTSRDKKEYIIIETDQQQQQIELIHIKSMQAVQPNPYFDSISFS